MPVPADRPALLLLVWPRRGEPTGVTPREGLEERKPGTGFAGEASVALTTERAARETATVLLDCDRVLPGAGTRVKVAAGKMQIRPC